MDQDGIWAEMDSMVVPALAAVSASAVVPVETLVGFGQFKWQVGFFLFQKNCMRRMEQKENMMEKGIALELGCCPPKL